MSTSKPTKLILFATRLELPGWGKVARWAGVSNGDRWKEAPVQWIRGKWHRYLMKLDLSYWSDRQTFFLGRYYELATQLALNAVVTRGDHVVDIGANRGMMTLHLASLVGTGGRVDSFEPNPRMVNWIREQVTANNITHVHVHPCGLGARDEQLTLLIPDGHDGGATFAQGGEGRGNEASGQLLTGVAVVMGDAYFHKRHWNPDVLKIDVEGFEENVIFGLRSVLARSRPIVVMELIEENLSRAGSSRSRCVALLGDLGYEGWSLATERRWLRHRLRIRKLSSGIDAEFTRDTIWIHRDDRRKSQVAQFVV